jgi:Peptidase family S64.
MVRFTKFLVALAVVAFLTCGTLLTSGLADGGANHRVRNQHFGVSGGNVNDITRRFCCSGTLGALVTFNGVDYVLSNNHVLGLSGNATVGDDISQPGLIDNNCRVSTVVADFTAAAPLGSNVDAAVAQLRPGQMDASGFIEDIGVPSSTVVAPQVGMNVAKSGRTTGFTTGTISSTNTSVSVQYQQNCGSGKKFVVSYTNQVVVNSSTFSAGGDSGSLIVTNDNAHNPVALLFAGSSTTTIGNPIGEVLSKLGAVLGGTGTFEGSVRVHGRGPKVGEEGIQPFIPSVGGRMQLPEQASGRALAVLEQHRANLMFQPGVIGAGVGTSADDDQEAAIVVYVDRTGSARPVLSPSLDGVPVRVVLTDPFVAF